MTAAEPTRLSTDERIGTNVHHLLWSQRVSQKQLASVLGITASVLSKKLRGGAWYADQVESAANFLGVRIERLYAEPTVP